MSTDLHIHCLNHNDRSDEVGNASRDIIDVRDRIARRVEIFDIWKAAHAEFDIETYDLHWDTRVKNTLSFIINHVECDLELKDEYGHHYDLSAEPTECFAWLVHGDRKIPCEKDGANNHQNHEFIGPDDRGVEFKVTWNAFNREKEVSDAVDR